MGLCDIRAVSPQGCLWDGDGLNRAKTLGHSMDAQAQQAGQQAAQHVAEPEARAGVSFANLLPPVADSDSRRPPEEQCAEALSAQNSSTGTDGKLGASFSNMLPAAAHNNRGASLPVTTQPAEQHLLVAAGDGPAVSSDAVPCSFSEADGGGASDREAAAAAAEAAMLKRETGVSNILLNSLSLCSPSTAPPRPAGQLSSQTDWSHTAATDEASVHQRTAPITLRERAAAARRAAHNPKGLQQRCSRSGGARPGRPQWAGATHRGCGREAGLAAGAVPTEGGGCAGRARAGQPEPRAAEAGQPDTSQPTLRQAESSQWESSQGEVRQAEPGQAELSRCKPTSASPVTTAGSAQLSSTIAAAGDGLGSTPVAALAVAAGSPGCTASPQATCMGSPGGAEPAMPQGRSTCSTDSRP